MSDALAMVAAGAGTWVMRASFIVLAGGRRMPPAVERALAGATPAVLAALAAGAVLNVGDDSGMSGLLPRLVGAAAAAAAAWWSRGMIIVLASGLLAYWAAGAALRMAA